MKTKIRRLLPLLLVCVAVSILYGCASKEQGPVPAKRYPTGNVTDTEDAMEEDKTEDATGLYMVLKTDTSLGVMTFLNIDTGRNEQYSYTDGTYFLDKYGAHTSAADFCPGKIVAITLRSKSLTLDEVQISDKAWEYDDVVRFSVDEEEEIFTIGDKKYFYDSSTVVFSGDTQTEFNSLTANDVLRIQGIDRKILSVSVTTGHGFVRLENEDDLLDGWLSLNHKMYYLITKNMQLEVPEGEYELTVAGNGYGGTTSITVKRGEETLVNVDEIKGEGPKFCTITFEIGVENAALYIDGEAVDYSQPLKLQYGIHELKIEAEGYDTWAKRLFVNSSEATIEVAMTTDTPEEPEESTEDTQPSTEKDSEQDDETDKSEEDKWKETLLEILDTLKDREDAGQDITDEVLDRLLGS